MATQTFKELAFKYIKSKTQKVVWITHSGNVHPFDPNNPTIYTDRILENIVTGDLEIFYDGQNRARDDKLLIKSIRNLNRGKNVVIKFYWRLTDQHTNMTEFGRITEAQIVQLKTEGTEELNKFHFVIKRADRMNRPIPIIPELQNTNIGWVKKMMLHDLGIIDYNIIPNPNKPGRNLSPIIRENFNDERDFTINNLSCKPMNGFGVFLRLDV